MLFETVADKIQRILYILDMNLAYEYKQIDLHRN